MKKIKFVIFFFFLCSFCGNTVVAASFVVNSNDNLDDKLPGNGKCETIAVPTTCSFKAAIQEANVNSGEDTITFAEPFVFPHSMTDTFPEIADNAIIDGSSQWNTILDVPGIVIDTGVGGPDPGLTVSGSGSAIKGLFFKGMGMHLVIANGATGTVVGGPSTHERNIFLGENGGGTGIILRGDSSTPSSGSIIQYNYFGTMNLESHGADTEYVGMIGISVSDDVDASTIISHNRIGEQSRAGIYIGDASPVISHNYIGSAGNITGRIPNKRGIEIYAFTPSTAELYYNTIAHNVLVQVEVTGGIPLLRSNSIGSLLDNPGESNRGGVYLYNPLGTVRILENNIQNTRGNGITLDSNIPGSTVIALDNSIRDNKSDGVHITGTATVGSAVRGNIIYSNSGHGILLNGTQQVVVQNNSIGVWSYGSVVGNGKSGVYIENGATGNLIGGRTEYEANTIGDNKGSGIFLTGAGTTGNFVAGNYIGFNKDSFGNYLKTGNGNHGIAVYNGAESNNIGSWDDGFIYANIILESAWRGIAIYNSDYNQIIGNKVGTDGLLLNWGNRYSGIQVIGSNNVVKQNTVAYNGFAPSPAQAGVVVEGVTSIYNWITQNSIYKNGGAGIDLIDNANQYMSYPSLQRTNDILSGMTCVNCTVEFFSGPDQNEGKYYEGSVQANASGVFSWEKQGHFRDAYVTATATSPFGFPNPNSSEFSFSVPGYRFPWPVFLPAVIGKD